MAKKSLEEKVEKEITEVVEKVTETPVEEQDIPQVPEEIVVEPEVVEKVEEKQPEIPVITEEKQPETPVITEEKQPETPVITEEQDIPQVPEEIKPLEGKDKILSLLAKANYYSQYIFGQYLKDGMKTSDEDLKAFYEVFKTGNFLTESIDYQIYRELNKFFK